MKKNIDWIKAVELAVVMAFGIFTVYVNAQKVPTIEEKVQKLDIRQSVIEAHYSDILNSLQRIEKRILTP